MSNASLQCSVALICLRPPLQPRLPGVHLPDGALPVHRRQHQPHVLLPPLPPLPQPHQLRRPRRRIRLRILHHFARQGKETSDTTSNPVLHEKSNCQIDHLFVMAAPAANAEPFDRINDSILETSQQQKVFFTSRLGVNFYNLLRIVSDCFTNICLSLGGGPL